MSAFSVHSTGVDIHVRDWGAPRKKPHTSILHIHGTGGHGGFFSHFAELLRARGYHPFALDLRGHGHSGGQRGVFTLTQWIHNISDVAKAISEHNALPLAVLGTSQGGEVAFHALQASGNIHAAICHNLLLSTEIPINPKVRFMQSSLLGRLARARPGFMFPLRLAFDWRKVSLDPQFLVDKQKDPLAVWHYSLSSYRTLFTTEPVIPPAGNHKPVLVAVGERDELVTPEHCLQCFMRIGGPKELCVLPGAAHQLVLDYPDEFVEVVDGFLRRHLR